MTYAPWGIGTGSTSTQYCIRAAISWRRNPRLVYRHEVTEAAVRGALDALKHFESGDFTPEALDYGKPDVRGELRPTMKQQRRAINWSMDAPADIARKIRAADSSPGVLDSVFGQPHYLFGSRTKKIA